MSWRGNRERKYGTDCGRYYTFVESKKNTARVLDVQFEELFDVLDLRGTEDVQLQFVVVISQVERYCKSEKCST